MDTFGELDKAAIEIIFNSDIGWSQDYTTLFHYTSKTAKDSIVNGNSYNFRFTKADDFLDKNEGLHILEPYRHVCGKLYDQNKIDARFFNKLASIAFDKNNTDRLIPWVLCATMNGCSQYMKERYAPNDGYIIGFQALAFQELFQTTGCDI